MVQDILPNPHSRARGKFLEVVDLAGLWVLLVLHLPLRLEVWKLMSHPREVQLPRLVVQKPLMVQSQIQSSLLHHPGESPRMRRVSRCAQMHP